MNLPFHVLLVCTDFSEVGNLAIPAAFRLAQDHGARVLLVHVLEPVLTPNPLYAHYQKLPTPEERAAAEERVRGDLEALVPAGQAALPHETIVLHGVPAEEVCRLAREERVSLIVLSSHGRTGLQHFFLGSVAERILRHAPCSVLVVR